MDAARNCIASAGTMPFGTRMGTTLIHRPFSYLNIHFFSDSSEKFSFSNRILMCKFKIRQFFYDFDRLDTYTDNRKHQFQDVRSTGELVGIVYDA